MAGRFLRAVDEVLIHWMRTAGVSALRIALGVVFLWFGALKVSGASPVANLVRESYTFFPDPPFLAVLGIGEMIIGIGLLFRFQLRATLALLWLQMAGTLIAPLLAPSLFFAHQNPLLLTTEGEFVVKNLVLIAAGLVVGGYEAKPLRASL